MCLIQKCSLGCFRSKHLELDLEKDFIETTAGGIDKILVSDVWVLNNSHLPFLALGCQRNNLAQTAISSSKSLRQGLVTINMYTANVT